MQPSSSTSRSAIWLAGPFLAALLGAAAVIVMVKLDSSALLDAAARVEREHARLKEVSGAIERFDRLRDGHLVRQALVDTLAVESALPILLLNVIDSFPEGIQLNSLSLRGKVLNLSGIASDDAQIDRALNQLREAGFEPESADTAAAGNDGGQGFEIRATFPHDPLAGLAVAADAP